MFHPLLENNLKKVGLTANALPTDLASWKVFPESLSLTNTRTEQDRSLLERSLSLVSEEMRQEITDRKRVEEALAEERNLLRTLIDASPDYIYIKDRESRFVIGNVATALSLGAATPDDIVGKTDFDFHTSELATIFYADEQALMESGEPVLNREETVVDQRTGKLQQHLIRQDCPLPPGTHVVAYCRDSGGDEQERSVGQQKAAITESCDKHQLILERIYSDEAKTGSDSERRSQLNQMPTDLAQRFPQICNLSKRNKHIKTHPFGLLTWKSNRLGRDNLDTTFNKADLRLRAVTIISMVAAIETGDAAMNAMFESMQQVQDERLLQEQSENTKRGLSDIVTLRDNDPDFRAVNPDWLTNDGRYLGVKPGVVPTGFRAERILIDLRDRKSNRRGGEKHYVQRIVPNHEDDMWARCYLAWQMRHEGQPIKKTLQATRLFKAVGGYDHFFENQIYTGTLV